ncbi:MAG: hypothetical protein, partial [Olavius algarvensis Gamma 1 endosymbiont]
WPVTIRFIRSKSVRGKSRPSSIYPKPLREAIPPLPAREARSARRVVRG